MVVQIRGTSGSGKSTVVRSVLKGLKAKPAYYFSVPNLAKYSTRKTPLYYATSKLVVLGNYEGDGGGGCDTIGSAPSVYELLQELNTKYPDKHALCEGLLLSEDVKWSSRIDWTELRVLFLTTTVEECVNRVRDRRKNSGKEPSFNESNTRNRVAVIERSRKKLVELGVVTRRVKTEQAVGVIEKWLKL